ncbi:hypothetical protein AUR66_12055 [Haloferax profundi]|uniref:Uncharacterized protein n=1 Tax=Haloferax profundi TaxID=1544718 RepID=A0A0W1SQ02_9EURY|nr:hypothetical protein AUR66_12055 [Haloferax profundi]
MVRRWPSVVDNRLERLVREVLRFVLDTGAVEDANERAKAGGERRGESVLSILEQLLVENVVGRE